MDPNTLAVAVAKILHKEDSCALALGIEVLEVRPGFARLCMRIREDMVNKRTAKSRHRARVVVDF